MTSADAATTPSAPRLAGLLAFVDHTGIAGGRSQGLDDGLDLVVRAEELGFDTAYVRHRHLQDFLSSPLPFLAAAGQRARSIRLGTSVIPLRFENAGRLAEDAATTDLLLGGRLHLGVSSGYAAQDGVNARAYGALEGDVRSQVDRVLADLLSFLDGEVVAHADAGFEVAAEGTALQVRPQVPGLRSRIAYGSGSLSSARAAGSAGIGLQLSTLQSGADGRSFEELQLESIRTYRAASREAGHGEGHVSVSRQALPVLDPADLAPLQGLVDRDRDRQEAARSGGASIGGRPATFGRVASGDPAEVAAFLAQDPALAEADELVLALPFGYPTPVVSGLVEAFGRGVIPALRETGTL